MQGFANTAWAFATVDSKDALLFAALAPAPEPRMSDFNPQGLANIAWTFATAGYQAGYEDTSLFAALATLPKHAAAMYLAEISETAAMSHHVPFSLSYSAFQQGRPWGPKACVLWMLAAAA